MLLSYIHTKSNESNYSLRHADLSVLSIQTTVTDELYALHALFACYFTREAVTHIATLQVPTCNM
jgi:hypothetical protein